MGEKGRWGDGEMGRWSEKKSFIEKLLPDSQTPRLPTPPT